MIDDNLNALEGKWFILYSNFPMWTAGKRVKPSLNYKIIPKKNKFSIRDKVEFEVNGRTRSIKGFDKYLGNGEFVWKGKGLLALLRSRWKIVRFEQDWMLIKFEKTRFTPAGYDLVSRNVNHSKNFQNILNLENLMLQKIKQ